MNFLSCRFNIVFHAVILDGVFIRIKNDVTRSWVFISRLAHAANVNHALFRRQSKEVIPLTGLQEGAGFRKDSWDMSVSLKAVLFKSFH